MVVGLVLTRLEVGRGVCVVVGRVRGGLGEGLRLWTLGNVVVAVG